jgi:hypothetical protein
VPSAGHQLEVAKFVATQLIHSVHLQWQRSRREEPDDERWGGSGFRQEVDLRFFLTGLHRLRETAVRVAEITQDTTLRQGIDAFNAALPDLDRMRNADEHIDEYLAGLGRDPTVPVSALGVVTWDDSTFKWAGMSLDAERAFGEAEALYASLLGAVKRWSAGRQMS